ncbi:unnamed protein product [Caenorhabditis bovis]|uniref:G-protein coupled receptors family 1 profile domain-containing protein n=1 Tax=Caenorhabditis bovis TaxID=2654633 RepID=A0A8S1E0G6_9PELO|nr:unnamed protein product [Caenorhabditis bovis]
MICEISNYLMFIIIITITLCQVDKPAVENVQGPITEVEGEIPPEDKDFIYYMVISIFIISIFASTILNGISLTICIVFWRTFEKLPFFWILTQLTLFVFISSLLNLVINIPVTLFTSLTVEFVRSDLFLAFSYIIDFCTYGVLFSNFVIAIQRFFVFWLPKDIQEAFQTPFIKIWLVAIWLLALIIDLTMFLNKCTYRYKSDIQKYSLNCVSPSKYVLSNPYAIQVLELVIQIMLPIINFIIYIAIIARIIYMKQALLNKQEVKILKQAVILFIFFQISSGVFLYCQTFKIELSTAFLVKRIINTANLLAGVATPLFFFATSNEIRKIFQRRVSATSSGNNSTTKNSKPTLRSQSPANKN